MDSVVVVSTTVADWTGNSPLSSTVVVIIFFVVFLPPFLTLVVVVVTVSAMLSKFGVDRPGSYGVMNVFKKFCRGTPKNFFLRFAKFFFSRVFISAFSGFFLTGV